MYPNSAGRPPRAKARKRFLQALTAIVTLAGIFSFAASLPASAAAPTPAHLAISPKSFQYLPTAVGASSASQSFAVTNTGQSASGPLSIAVTGANISDFVLDSNTCATVLLAGGACSVSVHFAPTATGARSATLSVSGTPGGSVTSSLKGTGATAVLAMSPVSHSYGSVTIGASSVSQTYTVTNKGLGASGPVSVTITGADAGDFTENSTTCGGPVAAGSSCTVSVTFTPAATGTRTATLTATASPGGSVTAALSGAGAAKALLAISPSSFDYGQVVPGASSAAKTFTVTNKGLAPSGTLTAALGGTNAADFVVDSTTCGAKLAVGASCTVQVHFAPAATGAVSATLSATASPGGTATAGLAGTGVTQAALSVTPATFDYGQVPENTASGDQTFTVTNTGQATSGTVAVSLGGANAADFSIDTSTCGAGLPGGGSCTVTVHFTPGSIGTLTASLSATAAPGGTASASLQGEGQGVAALSIDPTSSDFGQVLIGDTSATATFTVSNTGGAASGNLSVSVGGTNAGDFTIASSTCTGPLAAGGSCTVMVTFDSFFTGTFTASLTATAAPGGSASASLTAQAIVPAFFNTPNPVDFGAELVGASTTDQTVTITNEGQQTSGTLRTSLGGTNPGDFAIDSNTCTGTLAGGASCSVTVHFTPTALGSRSATLSISAFPGDPRSVALSGTGVTALYVSPGSYDFGTQHQGSTPAAATFTVTNFGTAPLTLQSLTGTDTSDFPVSADNCASITLTHGNTCTISIGFNTAALGSSSSTDTVTFADSSSNVLQASFTLSGTSIVPPPDLATSMSVASENFSSASVTITVTNLGSAASAAATMTIDADPTQNFSYEAGAGTDCTASFTNNFGVTGSQFSCPVPAGIAPGGTYTRTLTIQNLSGQAPHYVQCDATTIMPGDTNSSNNEGFATVILQ